ncbi:MAG TPA: hypothetical protein VEF04_01550 [Blastocatellia bacterium]|nr:hypothetical protein [Blastocatellia bacterium]
MIRAGKQVSFSLVIAIFFMLLPLDAALAQKGRSIVRRVNFPRNRTTTVLRGTLRRGISHDYLLRARAGQTMSVHLAAQSPEMYLTILKPGRETWMDDIKDWSGVLPLTGTYRINVIPDTTTERPKSYTLEITIR